MRTSGNTNTEEYLMIASQSTHPLPLAPSPISAGHGSDAYDHDYELLDLNRLATGGRPNCRGYIVSGDSAVPRIMHRDLVIVDPHAEIRNGDIVAASHNGLNYVKIFETQPRLRLVSPNQNYAPIEIKEDDNFCVLGKVCAHFAMVTREYLIPEIPVYDLSGVTPTSSGLFHIELEKEGQKLELYLPRDEVKKGIRMASKALKTVITGALKFRRPYV